MAVASALDIFLAAQADGSREAPLRAAHDAFRRARQALLGELPVACSERARAQVLDVLVARLAGATAPTFEAELDPARPLLDLSRDGWVERLERLPGLAEGVGLACRNWRPATHELFDRLAEDLPLLADRLWFGSDPGRLVEFRGDTGDLHAGGRSVAILTFAEGYRVVYKPKDLRVAAAFMELVQFLN